MNMNVCKKCGRGGRPSARFARQHKTTGFSASGKKRPLTLCDGLADAGGAMAAPTVRDVQARLQKVWPRVQAVCTFCKAVTDG